ncbi:hypothetical protein C0J52_06011 [Blattella germanica]|nr:hypothetical protein C0J52_06011 [Blattella germanica]
MVSAKGKLGPGENSSGMQSQADLPSRQFGESASDRNCPSEEPDPKRPRLELNSRTALPDKLALDSSSDILRSDHLRNVNLLSLNSKLSEQSKAAGNTKGQAHGRGARSVDGKNSVFDIIVQHNIYSQSKPSPGGKSSPMVFIPESNSQNSRKNVNAGITRNVNHLDSSSSQNVNVQDTAARISELKGELFKDWSRCLIADNDGNVPLHHAVLNENLTLVKRQCSVLCARKVQVDLPNNDKRTPLHLAVIDGNADIVKALVDFGAKPDVKDQDGNTALHLAIIDGNLECLRVLLSDARSGRTSLFHAVESNNGDLVRLLLEFEASTNEPNFAGHTPLMAANEISFSGVASLYSPDVMNFNSKLVSLKSGQILEGGGNVIIRGDAIEDMEEVSDGVGMSFMPTNYKGLWKAGD